MPNITNLSDERRQLEQRLADVNGRIERFQAMQHISHLNQIRLSAALNMQRRLESEYTELLGRQRNERLAAVSYSEADFIPENWSRELERLQTLRNRMRDDLISSAMYGNSYIVPRHTEIQSTPMGASISYETQSLPPSPVDSLITEDSVRQVNDLLNSSRVSDSHIRFYRSDSHMSVVEEIMDNPELRAVYSDTFVTDEQLHMCTTDLLIDRLKRLVFAMKKDNNPEIATPIINQLNERGIICTAVFCEKLEVGKLSRGRYKVLNVYYKDHREDEVERPAVKIDTKLRTSTPIITEKLRQPIKTYKVRVEDRTPSERRERRERNSIWAFVPTRRYCSNIDSEQSTIGIDLCSPYCHGTPNELGKDFNVSLLLQI